jgi:hypothetical protein
MAGGRIRFGRKDLTAHVVAGLRRHACPSVHLAMRHEIDEPSLCRTMFQTRTASISGPLQASLSPPIAPDGNRIDDSHNTRRFQGYFLGETLLQTSVNKTREIHHVIEGLNANGVWSQQRRMLVEQRLHFGGNSGVAGATCESTFLERRATMQSAERKNCVDDQARALCRDHSGFNSIRPDTISTCCRVRARGRSLLVEFRH